jgi:hypothetical protein
MSVEIPLKLKYRRPGRGHQQHKGGGNNQGASMGKHAAHPDVPGFKRNKYKCEPKWNPKPNEEGK